MDRTRIPLVLLTGFLGSGKTTVMNDMLARMREKRVAVVVNEWGKLGVDGSLLSDPAGLGITELPGGQIFCSCLAPTFLKALERLSGMDCDLILVETSGLAKPATIAQLAAEAERSSGGRLDYQGLICVVDALRFLVLRKAVMAVDEQASYADRFVVAKADAVDKARLDEIVQVLSELRPGAPVDFRWGVPLESDLGLGAASLSPPAVDQDGENAHLQSPRPFDLRWNGWGPGGRPRSTTLVPLGPVTRPGAEQFLKALSGTTFRIKGLIEIMEPERAGSPGNQARVYLADCVEEQIAIRPYARPGTDTARVPGENSTGGRSPGESLGLTIIWKKAAMEKELLKNLWAEATGRGAESN
jgi:G3E family GTPase